MREPRTGVRLNMNEPELTALLIAPDRELAAEFTGTLKLSRAFQIISELKTYPSQQTLEIRLRQVRPDLVLLDIGSNLDAATEIIRMVVRLGQAVHVVGLDRKDDSAVVLNALRAGASEFLFSPFDVAIQHEAVARLRRLRQPESPVSTQPGSIAVFSSAKPGAGASTLATQTAFALSRTSGKRVLLADFDLCRGMIGFFLKIGPTATVLEALVDADHLTPALWSTFVVERAGVDVLCAPDTPYLAPVDSARLHALMAYARLHYDWIIVDLPTIFQRFSLMALSNSDRALVVTTAELPSLHLARKAIKLLDQLGIPKERFQMVVNRGDKKSGIGTSEIEKLFNCKVHSKLPNDFAAVNRATTHGEPIDPHCELGKAIEGLALKLAGKAAEPKLNRAVPESRAVLSQA